MESLERRAAGRPSEPCVRGEPLGAGDLADELGRGQRPEPGYTGRGGFPPEHYHPRQDERFEVLEGAVKAIVNGEELRYVAGERFDIPAGTPHRMAGDGAARVHWEVRPGAADGRLFEIAYSGSAGPDFYDRFADEFRLTTS